MEFVSEHASEEECRLTRIRERLAGHRNGIPPSMVLMDFEVYAADDIEYLLGLLNEAQEEAGRTEREREEERVSYFDQASEDIETASKLMKDLESELESVGRTFKRSQDQLNKLKSRSDVQLADLRQELDRARREIRKLLRKCEDTERAKVLAERRVDKLKAVLDGLPPTWLERVQGT
jgi:chromosome segregation ATPase